MHLKGTMAATLFVASTVGAAHAQTVSAGGYSLTVIGDLGGPRDMRYNGNAVSADGKKLYSANGPSGDVSIVDVASGKVEKKIATGGSPWGVVVK